MATKQIPYSLKALIWVEYLKIFVYTLHRDVYYAFSYIETSYSMNVESQSQLRGSYIYETRISI